MYQTKNPETVKSNLAAAADAPIAVDTRRYPTAGKSLKTRCIHPFPVAVGTRPDGKIVRMSFWQPVSRAWDWARARRVCTIGGIEPATIAIEHGGATLYPDLSADLPKGPKVTVKAMARQIDAFLRAPDAAGLTQLRATIAPYLEGRP